MLDFGAIAPEINSALMYSGAGSTPLVTAASAWNALAAELNSAAAGYNTVITQLASDEWMGPASTAMASAAAPYVAWMNTTAAQAEQAATSAQAAAAAYEQAYAATVPPQVIAANRATTSRLVSTNYLGQNTPAIAQLQAQYGQMWAQDAAAMYSYAGQSSAATKVTSFSTPAATTNPAGQAGQAAAVTQATSASAGSSAQSAVSNALSSLASPAASTATDPLSQWWTQLWALLGQGTIDTTTANVITFPANSLIGSTLTGIGGSSVINPSWFVTAFRNFAGPIYNLEGLPYFSAGMANSFLSIGKGLAPAAAAAAAPALGAGAAAAAPALGAGIGGIGGGLGAGVSAGLGGAGTVGTLSVPPSWVGGTPLVAPAAPLPISGVSAAPDAGGAGNLLGGMPLAGVGSGVGGAGPRYGFRPTVMARPPFAG